MVIEPTYRQYDNDNQERWARGQLKATLRDLQG
jgi:hypothetical protein